MCSDGLPEGELLLVIATVLSIQLARGKNENEVALMAAFFTVLGDNLALLALRTEPCEGSSAQELS